jgi:protocatechuate 3,4-dioxygenase beta subunit
VTISNRGFVESTTTDENGRFLFEAVPSGRYAFRISAQGYALYECPIVVRDGDPRRNQISITAFAPADQQTVSVAELRRGHSPSSAPKGDRRQTVTMHDSLR